MNTRLEIAHLHRALGTTMIYVTHDQTEAMTLADKTGVMNGGHIQQADARACCTTTRSTRLWLASAAHRG